MRFRSLLGATLRDKSFFLAGFEKLLSPAGKATLAANRDQAEAIVETILAKGRFSFDVCYRLQGALNELQKLGLEMPPQINCFVQSMTRLQNTMAEMNTILNQMRVIADTVKHDVPPQPAAPGRDPLDFVGQFADMSRTAEGLAHEQAYGDDLDELGYVTDEQGNPTDVPVMVPHYVKEMQKHNFDGSAFGSNGEFTNKVFDRVSKAADPVAEARALDELMYSHVPDGEEIGYDGAVRFEKAWAEAKTPAEKTKAIRTYAYAYASASNMQIRNKTFSTVQFFSTPLEIPGGFAGVMMTTLFSGSDAADAMLTENFTSLEKGKILGSMKLISMQELGTGFFSSSETIMNSIIEDTKNLGGDDSYQIDTGV